MLLDDLEVYQKVAAPLMRPNTFTSLNQLSRRLRLPDDKVARAISRLGARLRHELVVKQNRRLVLTEQGERLARIANQLYAVTAPDCDDAPEVLSIDADPVLAETLLPAAMPDFLSAFGGLVAVRINRIDPDPAVLRERLANGTASFALGWADGDPPASADVLVPAVPWVALLPPTLALGDAASDLTPESLARAERVFVPGDERSLAALSGVLHAVPAARRIECESIALVRSMVAAGLGIGFDLELGRLTRADGVRRVRARGLDAEEQIAFFLPRKSDALSEAARSLMTAIRRVVSAPAEPEPEDATGAESQSDAEVLNA